MQPGYYETGKFGIRIESVLVTRPAKFDTTFEGSEFLEFQNLTCCPIQPNLVDVSLLREDELTWINDYNAWCEQAVCAGAHKRLWFLFVDTATNVSYTSLLLLLLLLLAVDSTVVWCCPGVLEASVPPADKIGRLVNTHSTVFNTSPPTLASTCSVIVTGVNCGVGVDVALGFGSVIVSPCLIVTNDCGGNPRASNASPNFTGGSSTGSSVNTNVPAAHAQATTQHNFEYIRVTTILNIRGAYPSACRRTVWIAHPHGGPQHHGGHSALVT